MGVYKSDKDSACYLLLKKKTFVSSWTVIASFLLPSKPLPPSARRRTLPTNIV